MHAAAVSAALAVIALAAAEISLGRAPLAPLWQLQCCMPCHMCRTAGRYIYIYIYMHVPALTLRP